MCLVTDLTILENQLLAEFKSLAVWQQLRLISKADIHTLLLQNYAYSKCFTEFVETAIQHSIEPKAKNAFEWILEEEQKPVAHETINRENLLSLGFKEHELDSIQLLPCTEQLIAMSLAYSSADKPYHDLANLCFYRLGAEMLAGIWYQQLVPAICHHFAVDPEHEQIKFFTLHAEHDQKTVEIGVRVKDMSKAHHADYFSRPVYDLLIRDGEPAYQVAQKAYRDAFQVRKAFVEGVVNKY